jgi:hypothetical protein
LNGILIDLEIFRESSDGFRFIYNRDVAVFGFLKFQEILRESDGFTATFDFPKTPEIELAKFLCLTAVVFASKEGSESLKKVCEMDPKLIQQSLLARNPIGQSFLHFLVDSGLQNSLIIEFLACLKAQFGLKFIGGILKLKTNDGFTFWSHAFANKKISDTKEIIFSSILEEISNKFFEKTIDFRNLWKLAFDLIFEREYVEQNYEFNEELFEIDILRKDDGVKFSDPCFFNYFALERFHDFSKGNYKSDKVFEFCAKLLSNRNDFNELCWLIEKFYVQKLDSTKECFYYGRKSRAKKKDFYHIARMCEQNETSFLLYLDILINQLKTGKNPKITQKKLFEQNGKNETFLHKFCWNPNRMKLVFHTENSMKYRS